MKHLLLFLLLANNAFCQSPSLDESKVTDSLNVSISWNGQNYKFTITDKVKATYTHTIWRIDERWMPVESFSQSCDISDKVSEKLLKLLDKENLMSLQEDNSRGVDGYFVFISFSDSQTSKKFVYWSPDLKRNESCKIASKIHKQLWEDFKTDSLNTTLINTLPPGEYQRGMGHFRIDRFLADDAVKTDFYKNAEQKIRFFLSITDATKHTDYPVVFIDDRYAYLADLNNYTLKDIKSFKIITKEQPERVLYGTHGENGIVLVTTKKKK